MILAYSAETEAIGIGSTGGGMGAAIGPKLNWEQLRQDLLVAGQLSDPVFIFSLEGCVQQGYLKRLATVDWLKIPSIDHGMLTRCASSGACCRQCYMAWSASAGWPRARCCWRQGCC